MNPLFKHRVLTAVAAACLFFLVITGVKGLCLKLDSNELSVSDGDSFPQSVAGKLYAVDYSLSDQTHVSFTLHGVAKDSASLILAYGRPFTVSINGREIYSFDLNSIYSRLHVISLNDSDFLNDGSFKLDFYSETLPGTSERLKIAIGDPELINLGIRNSTSVYYLVYGICLMILISCLVLSLVKHSEARYLSVLSVYALITAMTIFFAVNATDLKITLAESQPFQPYITTISYISGVMACVLLTMDSVQTPSAVLKKNYVRFILIPCIAYGCFLILLAVFHLGDKLRLVYRFFYFLGLPSLCIACMCKGRGCWLMLITYALIRALGDYSNSVSTLSTLTLFIRLSILDTIPFLLSCMIVVFWHFGAKFGESDRLNAELETIRASLDARIAECTTELEEDNRRLIEEEKRRHAMMTNIFHDIRNPLFAIMGCIDMINPENENSRRLIAICRDRLTQLRALTENLFLISKLEDKEVMFSPSIQDISKLCESLYTDFSVQAQRKGITLDYDVIDNCFVSGDAYWLRRVLDNLMDNAIKFTPENGKISIRLRRSNADSVIDITDTGKGIAPEDLNNIFDRYYHGSLDEINISSGLGLSIAKEIVSAHNGRIEVSSQPGKGSTFSIFLPEIDPNGDFQEEY